MPCRGVICFNRLSKGNLALGTVQHASNLCSRTMLDLQLHTFTHAFTSNKALPRSLINLAQEENFHFPFTRQLKTIKPCRDYPCAVDH